MQQYSSMGKENIARDDMVVPRIALLQAVHPEVVNSLGESGHFFHTIAEEDLGDTLEDLVIIHHSKRYTLWNPRHEGGGVLVRASDGAHWDDDFEGEIAPYKDRPKYKVKYSVKKGDRVSRDTGLGKWGTLDPDNSDSPPAATLTHVLVCCLLDRLEMGPFVMLLQRSAEPVAKMLLSKINLDSAPIFGQKFRVSSKVVNNSSSQDYNQYVFTKTGHVPDQDVFNKLMEMHNAFREQGVKFDENAAQEEATGDGASAPTDGNDEGSPGY